MTEREYLAALYSFVYFGPARTALLTSFFGSAKVAWNAKPHDLVEVGLTKNIVSKFVKHRREFPIKAYFARLKELSIKFLTIDDKDYPLNLRELKNAPLILYFRGELQNYDTSVAIVGSRKMSAYGKEVAHNIASELSQSGVTIISGLARGIDSIAHLAAIKSGGITVAVVANGLDTIYPSENAGLARLIVGGGGTIISEYPLGYPAYRENFANRNRIVSGMAKVLVVVEGEKKSGTLLTASHAADQGRTVFAVPGQITSPLSAAPHFLLGSGARLLSSTKDVYDELDLEFSVDNLQVQKTLPSTKSETKLLKILAKEPLHLDEVGRISGLSAEVVSARLTIMELKGLVKNIGKGVYRKI